MSMLTDEFATSLGHILVVQEFVVAAAFVSSPPLGSYLFEYYGFQAPFLALGVAQVLVVLAVPFLFIEYSLPDGLYSHGHASRDLHKTASFRDASYREVLSSVCITCLGVTAFAMAAFGFIDPYLGSHLRDVLGVHRNIIVGFGFAISALVYFIGGLIYMWLSRALGCRQVIVIGLVQLMLGFLFLGPAPFLNVLFLRDSGWLWAAQCVSLVLIGCGSALAIAPGLPITLMSVESLGCNALNLVVALFSAAIYFGQALGPVLSLFLMNVAPATRSINCFVGEGDTSAECDSSLPWTFTAYAVLAAAVLGVVIRCLPSGQVAASVPSLHQTTRRMPLARQPSEYGQYVFFDDEGEEEEF